MIGKTTLGLAAGALALAVSTTAQAETLRVATCFNVKHDQVAAFFKTFMEPLNAMASKTGLKLNYIGGPEITPRQKQASALQRGLTDILNCPSAYYQTQVPAARVAGVNTVPPAELRKNGGWELLQDAWQKNLGAVILGWGHWEASTFFIYTKFEPKQSTATGLDLKGIKMRSTGLYNAFLKKMGATPVNISPPDVYSALERGVVDGLAWPEGSVAPYGWERFLKYKIGPNFYHSTTMTIMNAKKFKSLSKKHQDLLMEWGEKFEKDSNAVLAKASEVDNAKLEKAGVKTIMLKGDVAKAYLNTIYGAKWAENDTRKYKVDYQALKSKVYKPGS
jgi:TRAP-type C4-dicarboxylate transport system substrate-binding protein